MSGPAPVFSLTPYRPPAPATEGAVRLDHNEGARPDPVLLAQLAGGGTRLLREYPSTRALEAALAERIGVPVGAVVVTNGADVALDRACRAFLAPGRDLLVAEPTFEMFPRFAAMCGAGYVAVPWGKRFPTEELLSRASAGTGVVALVSPNNPTGLTLGRGDLARIATALPRSLVILDHVYVEYADEDLTRAALALANVVVVRTFSKAWGLAGCRVGYAVSTPSIAEVLRAAGDPYPVAGPSMALALAALEGGRNSLDAHVAEVRRERAALLERFRGWDVPCPASQGNFVFPWFGADAARVQASLAADGLLVRRFADRPGLDGGLRISLPADPATFDRLLRALARALGRDA